MLKYLAGKAVRPTIFLSPGLIYKGCTTDNTKVTTPAVSNVIVLAVLTASSRLAAWMTHMESFFNLEYRFFSLHRVFLLRAAYVLSVF